MPEPLKELLFSPEVLNRLMQDFKKHLPDFPQEAFRQAVFDADWENRALKERMRHTTLSLQKVLPLPYPEAIRLFKKVIAERTEDSFGRMIFPDYVEVFGSEHLDISLKALEHFTEFASAEFAIRPLILQYGQPVIDRMLAWSKNKNQHVRRLASEGCRPRLPWAAALPAFKTDPTPILPILENLKADSSEYVRRSVANNLNDISKDNPKIALDLARKWKGQNQETDWVVKHGCRTLLKTGNTEALILFGFEDPGMVEINQLTLKETSISIGEDLHFSFQIFNKDQHPALLRLEYVIEYLKKTGKSTRKVFQITEKNFLPGKTSVKRKQSFQDFSTRTHYPGRHSIAILVNGQEKTNATFILKK